MTFANRFVTWPFRHFWLKVLSVGVAVLLWMVVSGEEIVERGLRVPLELQQVPANIDTGAYLITKANMNSARSQELLHPKIK